MRVAILQGETSDHAAPKYTPARANIGSIRNRPRQGIGKNAQGCQSIELAQGTVAFRRQANARALVLRFVHLSGGAGLFGGRCMLLRGQGVAGMRLVSVHVVEYAIRHEEMV